MFSLLLQGDSIRFEPKYQKGAVLLFQRSWANLKILIILIYCTIV